MDPITHGIAGSLLGKALFERREGRIATYVSVVGAVFPDVDVFVEMFAPGPLSVIRYHRGFTHSYFGLPIFAVALAGLTRWVFRRRTVPPFWMLTLIYAVGIASHILMDSTTSFGTRIWNPFSSERLSWDLVFIVDFSFTAILLVPQVAAWVFRDRAKSQRRGWMAWIAFNVAGIAGWGLALVLGFAFHWWILVIVAAILAALLILLRAGAVGFAIPAETWCRAGLFAALAYIAICAVAHHAALKKVQAFAAENHLDAVRLGAIPSPPSLLEWSMKIRVADGVYQARYDLRDPRPPAFEFLADSPHDAYVNEAMNLPDARVYVWFARFPVIRTRMIGADHAVDFSDSRFSDPGRRLPEPFRLRFVMNPEGQLVEEDWSEGAAGVRTRRMLE